MKPPSIRERQVGFIGTSDRVHPYRKKLLETLEKGKKPIVRGFEDRVAATKLYGRSTISFNCSLNGDLNLRVFEVLSAGAFLLTDELAAE